VPIVLSIQEIFVDPPLAIARLGGSSVPQDAFTWVAAPQPRTGDTTAIAPAWSLAVQMDATVAPLLPTQLILRDGPLIRPVCPFFEIWARIGKPGSPSSTWKDERLTPALLAAAGAGVADVAIDADARNLKAARRTGNPDLRFGTFPAVRLTAAVHAPVELLATSPAGVREPLIPLGMRIPLGTVQALRSRAQPNDGVAWAKLVNVEVLRFRFTPARGFVYGVPDTAKRSPTRRSQRFAPVDPERAFLNPNAGWSGAIVNELVQPADTYDGADVQARGANPSLGVVDDTCEVRFTVTLTLPKGRTLSAAANAFVAPPDFAPDRRPFLSLADEINDRGHGNAARTRAMSADERDRWAQDLFERIFETASLFNADMNRDGRAMTLTGRELRREPIPDDHYQGPSLAAGRFDALRNPDLPALPKRTTDLPLPLTVHALSRHHELADLDQLRDFIQRYRGRLEQIVRRPFEVERGANVDVSSMRMPPFMRNSNAQPLSLAPWQYDLLIEWVNAQMQVRPGAAAKAAAVSAAGQARRHQVLTRVRARHGARKPR
jgi:hypothetical protein